MVEESIVWLLKEKSSLVGKELYTSLGGGSFSLWKACQKSERIAVRSVARLYLRLDRKVPGYARLSPSLEREFLTYTVVGLEEGRVLRRAGKLKEEIEQISSYKMNLAKKAAREVLEDGELERRAVIVIAGDVPKGMAHSDPRPERALGMMVAGSDLDIVVVVGDEVGKAELEELDRKLMDVKYALLNRPVRKEELDYIIKSMSTLEKQMEFRSFEDKVACKILYEAGYLAGSRKIFSRIKSMLGEKGVSRRIERLEGGGRRYREDSIKKLLEEKSPSSDMLMRTFTTTLEFSEVF